MVKLQSTCFAILKQFILITVIHAVTLNLTTLQKLALHCLIHTLKLEQFSEYFSMQDRAEHLFDKLVQNCSTCLKAFYNTVIHVTCQPEWKMYGTVH